MTHEWDERHKTKAAFLDDLSGVKFIDACEAKME